MNHYFNKFKQMPIISSLQNIQNDLTLASAEPNFEKANNYSQNISELLLLIFGKDQQSDSSWIEKTYQNFIKISKETSVKSQVFHAEYHLLLQILLPPNFKNTKNLFTFILEPFNQEKRYEFEVKNLPQNTQILIEKKRFDNPILIAYFNFLELGKNAISPDGKRLILTIFELYLFVFISSLKRFVGRNHVDITTIEDYFRNDFEKEFVINPFLILVRRYLEFFFQTKQKHDKTIKTLLFLLQDFTINDYIQTSVLSNSNRLNNQINNNNFANRQKVPKPHVFQVVFLVVHYFHKHNADSDVRKTDFLMNSGFFAKSLYHFFINVLEAWNYDISNNSSLLSDLGNVWLQFLKPWEITETYSLINYLNLLDEGTISENNDFGAIFQENKVSKEMYKRENVQYISHFLKENVLFYTHVLKQFLITLSDQNEIHFKDFVFLKNMLDFLLGTTNLKSQINSLINGFINVNWIKQLSTGGNVKIEGSLDVMQYLDFMGAKLDNLNLFADESIVSRALNIITNSKRFLVTFKQKKKSSGYFFNRNSEWDNILISEAEKNVALIINYLIFLFSIEANKADSFYSEMTQKQEVSYKSQKQVRNQMERKVYLCWETPLLEDEYEILFKIFFYIAKLIDFIFRRKHHRNHPLINLRMFANPINSVKLLLVIFVSFLMTYLMFRWIFN